MAGCELSTPDGGNYELPRNLWLPRPTFLCKGNHMGAPHLVNLLKSVFHNAGVVMAGCIVAFVGTRIDLLTGLHTFASDYVIAAGGLLLIAGFLLRVWATFTFTSIGSM